jgi:NTE family protein
MTGRLTHENVPGIAGPKAEKSISLALQGGGAHGAFTWGVLDALLEDGRLKIEAITGASAGSMNAVVMVEGWIEGGIDGARSQLEAFWKKVSLDGNMPVLQRGLFDKYFDYWSMDNSPGFFWLDVWSRMASPYETNPLNINPLRDALQEMIDFEVVRRCDSVKLFIAATNVWSGKVKIFDSHELTADHLVASACLPTVFQAVDIDGVPYWDGGYMGNPALFPLFYETAADDVILVQINPIERKTTPRTAREIQNRLTEITFNSSLIRELRAIEFVARLMDDGKLSPKDYKKVLMHRIDGDGTLDDFAASSRMSAEWRFFQELRDLGRARTKAWLKHNYKSIGKRSTLDLRDAIS